MIVVKIQGGLGNQLLQYSLGRILSVVSGKEVYYDLSFFEASSKYTKRRYLLDFFNVEVKEATDYQIKKTLFPYGVLSRIIMFLCKVVNKFFLKKYYITYNEELLLDVKNKNNLYIEGYFQSYKYYEKYLALLSEEISLKDKTNIEKWKREFFFKEKDSVCLHVRRGDFLRKNAGTKALGLDYYKKAIFEINKKINEPTYYVFSDDIKWVTENLGEVLGMRAVMVSSSYLKDYEEFEVMKDCEHAIISNSTFSWFSVLLSNRKGKVVFYSKDWRNSYLNEDPCICPADWVGL